MPTPLVPNAAKVTVSGRLLGQLVQNVWYVTTVAAPTVADLDGIAAVFQIGYGGIMTNMSENLTIDTISVRYIGSASGPETSLFISPPQAGGDFENSFPGNVAMCVSLRTALAGRRFRGRKYFSGIPLTKIAGNTLDSLFAGNVVSDINGLIAALNTNGTPLSIVSFVGVTVVPVTTAIMADLNVDSMRRRLTGRGS